jgi:hypothetical protein
MARVGHVTDTPIRPRREKSAECDPHILQAAGYDTEGSGLTVGQLPPLPKAVHEHA